MSAVVATQRPAITEISEWRHRKVPVSGKAVEVRYFEGPPWQLCSADTALPGRWVTEFGPTLILEPNLKPNLEGLQRELEKLCKTVGASARRTDKVCVKMCKDTVYYAAETADCARIREITQAEAIRLGAPRKIDAHTKRLARFVPIVTLSESRWKGEPSFIRLCCRKLLVVPTALHREPQFDFETEVVNEPPPPPPSAPIAETPFVVFEVDTTCAICMDAAPAAAFKPCGHKCCCAECAAKVTACPICRTELHSSS